MNAYKGVKYEKMTVKLIVRRMAGKYKDTNVEFTLMKPHDI